MQVRDLIAALQKFDPSAEVVASCPSKGEDWEVLVVDEVKRFNDRRGNQPEIILS